MFKADAVKARAVAGTLVCIAAAFATVACGGGDQPQPPPAPSASVGVRSSASLGSYLVSATGRTLYYFALDLPGAGAQAPVSNCAGGCLAAWPIFHVDAPSLATGLNPSDFGEFVRADGAKQTTFKGWPVYDYAGDAKAGDTNGDNLGDPRPTDLWFVIKEPFYSALFLTKIEDPTVYLADPAGRAVYVSSHDTAGAAGAAPVSTCVDACLNNWPVFLADGDVLPSGVDPSRLTIFTRPDGTRQSALDGRPLHFFKNDTLPGDTKGRGGLNGQFDIFELSAR